MDNENEMSADEVTKFIENFHVYLDFFSKNNPFSGPSHYFHSRVISLRRSEPLYQLLQSDIFIELLYATLVSWGMHRMDRGARMKSFEEFRRAVRGMGSVVQSLQNTTLADLSESVINLLLQAFDGYTVMHSNPKLVGNAKVLHHLLPDLVPPIDKNTNKFFKLKPKGSETDQFRFVMTKFKEVHDQIDWDMIKYKDPINTSRPKLIDNALIGYRLGGKQVEKQIERADKEESKQIKKEEKKKEREEFKEWRKKQKG